MWTAIISGRLSSPAWLPPPPPLFPSDSWTSVRCDCSAIIAVLAHGPRDARAWRTSWPAHHSPAVVVPPPAVATQKASSVRFHRPLLLPRATDATARHALGRGVAASEACGVMTPFARSQTS
eukprot:4468825-Prymnesium_polylepis.1